jgi:hypothetical protein
MGRRGGGGRWQNRAWVLGTLIYEAVNLERWEVLSYYVKEWLFLHIV